MRTLLISLLLFAVSCSKAQTGILGVIVTPSTPAPKLLIIGRESNSGAQGGNNSEATAEELAPRAQTMILHPYLMEFQPLDVGTNNNIGHYQQDAYWYTTHSIELEVANRMAEGTFVDAPLYVVKIGQGGTQALNWGAGATYAYPYPNGTISPWDTAQKRIDSAIAQIQRTTGRTPDLIFFDTQGINDQLSAVSAATWKTRTKDFYATFRAKYGEVPIFLTLFESPMTQTGYNTVMGEIASELPKVYTVSSSGAPHVGDGYHWTYTGLKTVATNFIAAYQANE